VLHIPISCAAFYGEHFEKHYFYAPNAAKSGIFTWNDLDDLIFALDPEKHEDVKLMLGGRLPGESYSSIYQDLDDVRHRIIPKKLEAVLQSGATMVVNRMDLKSRKIASICQAISDLFRLKTVANGYLALDGGGAFGKHWDTHDVFALQLFGRKRWRIFEPTFPLPMEHHTSVNLKNTCPEITVFDGVLAAGDLLYIPRGWWHEATPLANEPTFHLAIGGHTAKLVDYLVWVAMTLLPMQELARASAIDREASLTQFAVLVGSTLSDPGVYSKFLDEVEKIRNSHAFFDLESSARMAIL
jgi:50S ribosomal protein L16 3-hydroxylase